MVDLRCYTSGMRLIRISGAIAVAVIAAVLWAGVATAQDGAPVQPDPYVGGTTTVPAGPDNPAPEPPDNSAVLNESLESASSAGTSGEVSSSTLAFTGGDIAALSIVGLGAVALGSAFVLLRRRGTEPVA